jgi:cytochrome c-type biogenesis protein CcmH
MVTFLVLAAAFTAGAVLLVAVPLLRRGTAGTPEPWSALAATGVLVIGSAFLYLLWSNWPWHAPLPGDSPQTMVAHLARRLEEDPNNVPGWLMLGRSYVVLQEYPLALRAFERADRLSGGKSSEALVGQAEALVLADESEFDGRAGRLIDRALALQPDSGQALFFGAALAARRGDLKLARARYARILDMNPPPGIRPLLESQLAAIDERLAATAATGAGAGPDPGAANATAPAVRVNITLGPGLPTVGTAPLFVFVRHAGEGGPPLAAKRLESRFPQTVTLTPADAMIPGRSFAPGQDVEVVARIARSGSPVGASGDPFGQVNYHVGRDGVATLVIDRLTP